MVLRTGNANDKIQATQIIAELGNKNNNKLHNTIYDNSQNAHTSSFDDSVYEFVKTSIANHDLRDFSYSTVHKDIAILIKNSQLSQLDMNKAKTSLNRISCDPAKVTPLKISIQDILRHVYYRIVNYPDKNVISELKNRLINELIDMAGWCSSGHSTRLVNVLSVYDTTLRISWQDQIKSNITARLYAKIKNITDDDLQESVINGMVNDASQKDKDAFSNYIRKELPDIQDELYDEFVNGKYITKDEFDKYFELGIQSII